MRVWSRSEQKFREAKRWMEKGFSPAQINGVFVGQGRVCYFSKYAGYPYTIVRIPRGYIKVTWVGDVLPPGVVLGAKIGFMGIIQTGNAGKLFHIRRALRIRQGEWNTVRKLFLDCLKSVCYQPQEYIPPALMAEWEKIHAESIAQDFVVPPDDGA